MARAVWNDTVIAETDAPVMFDNNVYFPPDALVREHYRPSDTHTVCPWKGTASYYDVVVGDAVNGDAAWYYPVPKEAAEEIRDHVAFWKGVVVEA